MGASTGGVLVVVLVSVCTTLYRNDYFDSSYSFGLVVVYLSWDVMIVLDATDVVFC